MDDCCLIVKAELAQVKSPHRMLASSRHKGYWGN